MDKQDSVQANEMSDLADHCLEAIKADGLVAEVASLGVHDSDAVKFFAAAALKETHPADARRIYDLLSTSSLPYVAVSAKYIARGLPR